MHSVRVLEVGGGIPAAMAAKLLADLGAQVVKIEPPDGEMIAVLTPIKRPALSRRGPPEFPGLMAASVWITPRMGRRVTDSISLPSALTTPGVSDWSRPNGLPIAKTLCPT